jgi:hypothetical protein
MNPAANFGWDSLRHGGLLLDPQRVSRIADYVPSPLSPHLEQELRRQATGILEGSADVPKFIAFVIQQICGFSTDIGSWQRGPQVGSEWTRQAVTGEAVRPRQLWRGRNGGILPVFVDSERLGQGRGRRAVSQVHQWLRLGTERLAILTNGRQWRLIFAGLDFDAWCEWDIDLWFEQGALSSQVMALRTLIAPKLWIPPAKDAIAPLLQAVLDSRKGQAELSAVLGERVREAVEILVQAHGEVIKDKCADVEPADIYRAAVRVVMRLVVALFAESRDLLPRDIPFYHEGYGVAGLLEGLEKTAARSGNRLARSWSAWPRLLSLFRLIHSGSHHEALTVPAYGGELFALGDCSSTDGLSRTLTVFESACFEREVMSDRDVHDLLNLLTRTRIKIRQGRNRTWMMAPVDFSDLSSEYIGILYEGLLDFELKTADAGDPVVFLAVGHEPALPLSRLEAMDDKALASLLEKMKNTRRDEDHEISGENGESSDESAEEEELDAQEDTEEADELGSEVDAEISEQPDFDPGDKSRTVRTRAETWARRAVLLGKLVPKPRGALTPEKRLAHDQAVGRMAARLVSRVVLPGEHYLVRWGGTRKGAGTFYTRPGLAVPTVHRTLRPLAYNAPLDADGKPNFDAMPSAWTPKKPEEILALKICDPACGSGTFPVAALRFLTEAVYEALHAHNRLAGDIGRPLDEILGLVPAGGSAESIRTFRLPCRPGEDEFERKTKAVLRRYVVERSIYGVDIDPLAVELCRLSLWIETMDRMLPFSFLDHKIKCGNSLVGAWFDQFRHYPAMAWKNREGGDKSHTNGVHFAKESRTKAIKAFVKDRLVPDLVRFLADFALFPEGFLGKAESAHEEALAVLSRLHEFPIHESAERARVYREKFLGSEAYRSLKVTMDLWCACWFWPPDELDKAPLPTTFFSPAPDTLSVAQGIARKKRFFHWELEFPDVFRATDSGFDAMLGNPPWETLQPNSKEYFSNHDPLYRSYGKQEALRYQAKYFENSSVERDWLDYLGSFSDDTNWMKYVASPFGDPERAEKNIDRFAIVRGNENEVLHKKWRETRKKSKGFSIQEHPFVHQGEGKAYTYKLFLEQVHALIQNSGRLGFIVPSGLYSDYGTGGLRRLFLDRSRWEWLFGFENREKIFDIDSRFKFNPVIIEKASSTAAIHTSFMRRKLEDWERGEELATPYSRAQVERFSPRSLAILEIQSKRDLEILEKIYANSVLLGDESPDGWGIKYAQGDFNMTSDSKLFPPRPWWEEHGYRPDEYSRWLKGDWRPISELWAGMGIDPAKVQPVDIELEDWLFDITASPEERQARAQFVHGHLLKPGDVQRTNWRLRCAQPPYDSLPIPRADIPAGIILSRDADAWIREDTIEDTALPLYEGRMIGQFDFSQKGWVSGKGRGAVWRDMPWEKKLIEPQFLMANKVYFANSPCPRFPKLSHMRVGSATNERSAIGCVVSGVPTGDTAAIFFMDSWVFACNLVGLFNSFIFDFITRKRLVGLHLDYHIFAQNPISKNWNPKISDDLKINRALAVPCINLSTAWVEPLSSSVPNDAWRSNWAVLQAERLRLRVVSDAIAFAHFGITLNDAQYILSECASSIGTASSCRIDTKGFWRIDKDKDPELRHTVLTLVAFNALEQEIRRNGNDCLKGIEAFLNESNGEGWMLPETVCLADYGLGHDERSKHPQPVAARLGPRFYDWQLAQNVEESWRECHLHASNLLGNSDYEKLLEEINKDTSEITYSQAIESESIRIKKVAEQHGPLFSSRRDKEPT